jgi:hypothetical protein
MNSAAMFIMLSFWQFKLHLHEFRMLHLQCSLVQSIMERLAQEARHLNYGFRQRLHPQKLPFEDGAQKFNQFWAQLTNPALHLSVLFFQAARTEG